MNLCAGSLLVSLELVLLLLDECFVGGLIGFGLSGDVGVCLGLKLVEDSLCSFMISLDWLELTLVALSDLSDSSGGSIRDSGGNKLSLHLIF
ncbi:hypothetical protein GCK72_018038 [Caenorhabditis remanei]|uniref:Uncharacterized protein n=1 Tax=Caenorhabditis remanei TaxID=31234 RepID=A0A6A5GA03_CAERE|nr:hypothetical protein GCK72_018038 [Caenorhabditis remanei]KAF1751484.1 hypothetical protein GCK72_018038 [Caenorhabditis remanei]